MRHKKVLFPKTSVVLMKRHNALIIFFLAILCFYLAGLAREPLPGDVSVYLRRAYELDLDGFAQTHSLFLVLAKTVMVCLPFLTPPLAAALVAAVCATITVLLVFLSIRELTGQLLAAGIGSLSLAVSHTQWFHAVIPEVYSLNAAFLAGMVFCAIKWRRSSRASYRATEPQSGRTVGARSLATAAGRNPSHWLFGIGLLGGLGCANHMLGGLSLAVIAAWIAVVCTIGKWRPHKDDSRPTTHDPQLTTHNLQPRAARGLLFQQWSFLGKMVTGSKDPITFFLGAMIGLLPLGLLVFRDAHSLGAFNAIRMALVGGSGITGDAIISYGGAMGTVSLSQLAKGTVTGAGAFLYNFASPAAVLAGLGLTKIRKLGSIGMLLIGLAAVHLLFSTTYAIHEAWAFLLPVWVITAIFIGYGYACTHSFFMKAGRKITVLLYLSLLLLPMCLYAVAPSVAAQWLKGKANGRVLSGRAYASFYLFPPKSQAGKEATWMSDLLDELPDDVVLALRPGYRSLALYLQKVEKKGRTIQLRGLNSSIIPIILEGGGAVFTDAPDLSLYLRPDEAKKVRLIPWNDIWRIDLNSND